MSDPIDPAAIRGLSDDDLLAQINAHDPYDAEFARRFRANLIRLEAERAAFARLRQAIAEASAPDFLWGAMDNVTDMDTTLDDYAKAASRAIRAAVQMEGQTND